MTKLQASSSGKEDWGKVTREQWGGRRQFESLQFERPSPLTFCREE